MATASPLPHTVADLVRVLTDLVAAKPDTATYNVVIPCHSQEKRTWSGEIFEHDQSRTIELGVF